ncbi:MAG: hypothetical protein NTV21_05475 [Planctomycetota bacterium]|nr:hypothetical protein [Planctomycetota bacterium]
MNMGMLGLWIAQLTFSVLLAGAGTALLAPAERMRGAKALAALSILPLLALHAVLAWQAAVLRVEDGVLHAPWRFSASLFALHLVAGVGLFGWARTGRTLLGWSGGRLALGALVAAAFSFTTLRVLNLEASLSLAGLRSEAGQTAYELAPPISDPALDAGPIYERANKELFEGDDWLDLSDFTALIAGKAPLEPELASVRAALERAAPWMDSVRNATRLPHCRSTPTGADELVRVPRILSWIGLTRLLCLEARVRAASGDVEGAVEDCEAALRLSEQLAGMPTLISLAGGSVARAEVLPTLLHVVSLDGIRAEHLARLDAQLSRPFARLAHDALRMEEAFGLALIGSSIADGTSEFVGFSEGRAGWLTPPLYAPFLLKDDVRGYRELMQELLLESRMSFEQLAELAQDDSSMAARARAHGTIAAIAAPNLRRVLLQVQRNDALVRLARLALQSSRERLATGSFPTTTGKWSEGPDEVRVEGDGSSIRIFRADPSESGKSLEVSLPAR